MLPDQLAVALADRYRIARELGHGGVATVYLAEDPKHHRKAAIKVLGPEFAAALGAERFLRGIETTASLRHPHILPLHETPGKRQGGAPGHQAREHPAGERPRGGGRLRMVAEMLERWNALLGETAFPLRSAPAALASDGKRVRISQCQGP